jgi:hypothetical protein
MRISVKTVDSAKVALLRLSGAIRCLSRIKIVQSGFPTRPIILRESTWHNRLCKLRNKQQPEKAKGFVFITLEDEDGLMNVIVRPDVYERYYKVLRNCFLLIVEGMIQKQPRILNVLATGAVGM